MKEITILDLPKLTPIEAHWLNTKPLDNYFLLHVQSKDFYREAKTVRPDNWKHEENKLAMQLKFKLNSPVSLKQSAIEKFGKPAVDNAYQHFTHLCKRNNISPLALHYAAMAWYIEQIIDIEKTKELNGW
jgi:hypothetical protein